MTPFQDGLGDRQHIQDIGGRELEVLCLRKELASVPSFEFALRERVSRLENFKHSSYGRVRSVQRTTDTEHALTITSDRTAGLRLSELLAGAERRGLPVDIGSALCLIRQLVSALAMFHETARDAAHGALAPERLIVTPNARLVIVDYALGSALEQLLYSRDRYWVDLRVALPRVAGLPHFDHLTDVTQIGVVALALILGRPLKDDEYPGKLADAVAAARAVAANGESEQLPQGFRQWLERATQLDQRQSFPSAVEARAALEAFVDECGYDASPDRLHALLARYRGEARADIPQSAPSVMPRVLVPAVDIRPADPIHTLEPAFAIVAPTRPSQPAPSSGESLLEFSRLDEGLQSHILDVPRPSGPPMEPPMNRGLHVRRGGLVAATAVAAVLLGSGATLASRHFLIDAPAIASTGTLTLNTDPTGASASVDGVARGATPLTLTLSAGAHTLALRGAYGSRNVSVTILGGAQVAHYVDLPKEAAVAAPLAVEPVPVTTREPVAAAPEERGPLAGWVAVAGRFDVQVYEDGKLLGSSESDRIMVSAGRHEFDLVNDALGYRAKRSLQVAAGQVAHMTFDPPTGTMALNALPWAEVWIDGGKVGETPIGNVTLPIGEHDVVFRHPDLGERAYRVTVTLKSPARLSVDLRQK